MPESATFTWRAVAWATMKVRSAQAQADGFAQLVADERWRFLGRHAGRFRGRGVGQRPVRRALHGARRIDTKEMAGRQLGDPGEHRAVGRRVSERQIVMQRIPVHRPGNPRMTEQGLDLRCEEQHAVAAPVVQRFLAEPIAGEQQPAPPGVPEREREHAAQVLDAEVTVTLVGGQDHLGVARRGERPARRGEPGAKLAEVVDLAVEDDVELAVGARHRLTTGDEIDDGKPCHAEPDARTIVADPRPLVVGAAMLQRPQHGRERARGNAADVAGDAAHQAETSATRRRSADTSVAYSVCRRSTIPATVNRSATRARAARPIRRASAPLCRSARAARAVASASRGGTRRPLSPGSMISATPFTLVATTGRSIAIASSTTNGNPSETDDSTKTSMAPSKGATSACIPVSRHDDRNSRRAISASTAPRSGPSPTTRAFTFGRCRRTSATA